MKRAWIQVCRFVRSRGVLLTDDEKLALLAVVFLFLLGLVVWILRLVR